MAETKEIFMMGKGAARPSASGNMSDDHLN